MNNILYYYNEYFSRYEEDLYLVIAEENNYLGEEGLMRKCQNEICVIDDYEYLQMYCIDYGYDYDDLKAYVDDEFKEIER